jgi:hypothetical protein
MLGEHQHPGLRQTAAQLKRGTEAIGPVPRRHLNIDDRHVRSVGESLAEEVLGVTRLAHHLESGLFEQARDALAEKDIILCDNDARWRGHM